MHRITAGAFLILVRCPEVSKGWYRIFGVIIPMMTKNARFQMGAGEGQDGEPRVFVKCSYCTNFKSGTRVHVPHCLVLKESLKYRFFGFFAPVDIVPRCIYSGVPFRKRYSPTR
jgi:hypothetical protein